MRYGRLHTSQVARLEKTIEADIGAPLAARGGGSSRTGANAAPAPAPSPRPPTTAPASCGGPPLGAVAPTKTPRQRTPRPTKLHHLPKKAPEEMPQVLSSRRVLTLEGTWERPMQHRRAP